MGIGEWDKRAILLFRIFLNGWEQQGSDLEALRNRMREFVTFVRSMRLINKRKELIKHDLEYLAVAQGALQTAGDTKNAHLFLEMVYGRSEELDDTIRKLRTGDLPATESLIAIVSETHQQLEQLRSTEAAASATAP